MSWDVGLTYGRKATSEEEEEKEEKKKSWCDP